MTEAVKWLERDLEQRMQNHWGTGLLMSIKEDSVTGLSEDSARWPQPFSWQNIDFLALHYARSQYDHELDGIMR